MFSGKTGEMFRVVRRHMIAKKQCIVIKYSLDTRYAVEEASTHDHFKMSATPAVVLADVRAKCMQHEVIGIDEGQFFPDVVEFAEEMANLGKTVIVACLDGTFQRKPFGRVLELLALAESVTKLSAVCMLCQANAAFSKRIGSETAVEVIGGADKYVAVCRACYFADQEPAQQSTAAAPAAAVQAAADAVPTSQLAALTLSSPLAADSSCSMTTTTSTGSASPVHAKYQTSSTSSPSPSPAMNLTSMLGSPLA